MGKLERNGRCVIGYRGGGLVSVNWVGRETIRTPPASLLSFSEIRGALIGIQGSRRLSSGVLGRGGELGIRGSKMKFLVFGILKFN